MGSSARTRIVVALCLCLAGAAVAGVLLGQHHGEPWAVSTVNEACGDGQTSGCEDVARSSWSSFAGLPVAGVRPRLLPRALAPPGPGAPRPRRPARLAGRPRRRRPRPRAARGPPAPRRAGLRDPRLLRAVHPDLRPERGRALRPASRPHRPPRRGPRGRPPGGPPRARRLGAREPRRGGGRPRRRRGSRGARRAAAGDAARRAGVAARDRAARRRRARPAAPDGGQAAPAPAPAESPAGPQDAKYWQERAQKLQATLDDPQKLDAYFAEKAQREYDTAAVVPIDLEGVPAKGPATAPVKVVEYSDFMCPFCRQLAGALSQLRAAGRRPRGRLLQELPARQRVQPQAAALHPPRRLQPGPRRRLRPLPGQVRGVTTTRSSRPSCGTPSPRTSSGSPARRGSTPRRSRAASTTRRRRPTSRPRSRRRRGSASTPRRRVYVNGKKLPRINDFVAVVDKEARKKGFPPLGQ